MKLSQNDKIIYGIFAVIIIALVVTNIPSLNINVPGGEYGSPSDYEPPIINVNPSDNSPSAPSSSGVSPTSLTVTISPNPMNMGGMFYGVVIGNGYNVPITLYGKNLGSGEVISFGALLNSEGKYEHVQQLNTPGYWQFWATSGSVESNKVELTCRGILVVGDRDHYSHTFGSPIAFKVYTHYTSQNVPLFANDPAHSSSIYMTNLAINSKGYCAVSFDFDSFANGDYEVDTMINSETASSYGGSFWVDVGR